VGKTLALHRGYYFWGVTEQASAGNINVLETASDIQNLKLVLFGRVDATIMSSLTLKFYQDTSLPKHQLIALAEPHDRFTRHQMLSQQSARAYAQLAPTIEAVSKSQAWKNNWPATAR